VFFYNPMADAGPPVGSRGKALVGGLGTMSPRSWSKCEIFVQFL